jgi:hypothetical protein
MPNAHQRIMSPPTNQKTNPRPNCTNKDFPKGLGADLTTYLS